ncbi:hypothetical protein B0G80_1640 [Paraburkholderia sp. BL6669N2]|nr:hypothetical protein B0G80_1640 [Paraburkholderia sp. BL6669N2]
MDTQALLGHKYRSTANLYNDDRDSRHAWESCPNKPTGTGAST